MTGGNAGSSCPSNSDAVASARPIANAKGVRVEGRVDSPIPVLVDPLQIQEVLMHLVKNAFEATSKGNVRIRIEDRGEFHAILVSDTGKGIPPDVMPNLFQPFYTTKAGSGGIGLGLLQSKHIATGHGGTIDVTSEPGKGSTFTVFLPRRRSNEDPSRR